MNFATEFHTVTALMATMGAALLIWRMNTAWPYITRTGQRMLYITLMWFSMTVAYAAAYDIQIGRLIELSAILFTVGCALLIGTMVQSIRKTKRQSL